MIFDQLCGVAERQFAPIMRVLRVAKLHHFPRDRMLPARFDIIPPKKLDALWRGFRLSAPYVAVETSRNLVIVWEETEVVGLAGKRCALVATPLSAERALRASNPGPVAAKLREAALKAHQEYGEFLLVALGHVEALPARPIAFSGLVDLAFTARKDEVIQGSDRLLHGSGRRVMTRGFLDDVGEAYARLVWLTMPEFRRRRPPTSPRPVPPGKVARSDQREVVEAL